MPRHRTLYRLALTLLLAGSLGACAIVPLPPPAYRGGPAVIVESYPGYRYESPSPYYQYERRPHHHGYGYYR